MIAIFKKKKKVRIEELAAQKRGKLV